MFRQLSRPLTCSHCPKTAWSSIQEDKEACKSSLKAAPLCEFQTHIDNAKHTIENLTNNGELDTSDGQLLLRTSTTLEKLAKSNLSDLKDSDRRKEKYEFCSLIQNTMEEFEFKCT